MKSFRKMIMLPIVILSLASCKTFIDDALSNAGSDGWTATSMLTALYAAGYEDLEENNTPDTWAYRESYYLDYFSISVDVIGFYQGYVNEDERWMKMEVFGSNADAATTHAAVLTNAMAPDYIFSENNVLLQTSSLETYNLFASSSSTSSEDDESEVTSTTSTIATTSDATTSTTSTTTSIATSTTSIASGEWTAETMLSALYAEGYENLDYANDSGTWDFRESKYLEDYDLTVEVIGFYQGWINVDERWMMMEVFGSTSDANDAYGAIAYDYDNPDLNGLFFVFESNVVLRTSSYDTANLFY